MRGPGKRRVALAVSFVVLATLIPSVAYPLGVDAWLRVSRAVVPNASTVYGFTGKPVTFLSVEGDRWVSWSERKGPEAVYHLLFLLPSVPVTDAGRSPAHPSAVFMDSLEPFGGGGRLHPAMQSWLVETGGRTVEMRFDAWYDAAWRTVRIGDRRYSLSNGNVFVVRIGEGLRPGVTQIDTTIAQAGDGEVLKRAVLSRLHGDEAARRTLRDLHRYDDCESSAAPVPGSGEGNISFIQGRRRAESAQAQAGFAA